MSGNESSATATLAPTNAAVVSAVISATDEEEEDPALTLDCVESAVDMDLVNGPNPWLPAYGFQLQHHSQFQPTHLEDLRANGSHTIMFLLSSRSFLHSRVLSSCLTSNVH
ncbi:hypothetical protein ALC56_04252 [Trachymyrmex septentrionalis]|uniref:Uncharacterized protein n=1 Tax=Trachymyrmex septentrionalis TaxID=34720 RepID=A0A195FL78_9HYME|nr:hypothetical protein ALC56_04252 [Trachymyrmex septentrionalis]